MSSLSGALEKNAADESLMRRRQEKQLAIFLINLIWERDYGEAISKLVDGIIDSSHSHRKKEENGSHHGGDKGVHVGGHHLVDGTLAPECSAQRKSVFGFSKHTQTHLSTTEIAKSLFVPIKPPQLSKGLPVDVFDERSVVYQIDFEVLDKHSFNKMHRNLFALSLFKELQDALNLVKRIQDTFKVNKTHLALKFAKITENILV